MRGIFTFGTALTVGVVVLFWVFGPETDDALEFTREAIARVLSLSAVAYGLAFCARNYRVNKHLLTVNETRYKALETASVFQAGVFSDTARDIVVAELVRSVFTGGDTGFLTGESEKTVVDNNPGGMLTALAAITER